MLAAAASVPVAVVVGVQGVQDRRELDTLRQSAVGHSQGSDLLSASDAKVVSEPEAGGGEATVVISPSRAQVVFLARGLPSLSADRDHRLWVAGTGDPRPAGLLRGEPVVAEGLAGVRAFASTVEPSGGSPAPTTAPVLAIAVE